MGKHANCGTTQFRSVDWVALIRFAIFLIICIACVSPVHGEDSWESFLRDHCFRCHGPQKEEGSLRIDQLNRNFGDASAVNRWAEVLEKVASGQMPPKPEAQPSQQEIEKFISTLDQLLKQGRAVRMAARPSISHYRLSRSEYQNTIYDLLGVRYDPTKPGELNEDTRWHGFDRIGSELSLSPSHMDRYYRAAEQIIDRALSSSHSEDRKVRKTAIELHYNGGKEQQAALDHFGIQRPLRYLLFPGRVQTAFKSNWFGKSSVDPSGLYRVRFQASGIRPPGGQPAHLSLGKETGEETVDGLVEFDIVASEDHPQIYEAEVFLDKPTSLEFCVVSTDVIDRRQGAAFRNALSSAKSYLFTHSSEPLLLNPNAPQMFDDRGNGIFSTVILDWIEWEGPIVSVSEKALRGQILPPEDATDEIVAAHLQQFAQRAWRRKVQRDELVDYLAAYVAERKAGESLVDAYRVALLGILTSRNFIYIVEGEPKSREQLTDSELATRLSYFLWSSMPDEKLLDASQNGGLHDETLAVEVDRILGAEKINRFVEDFARQWLQLHRVGMFPPDKKLYPKYDAWLEASLRREPVEYFREVLFKNLSVDSFVESDWTVANARICEFYGLPEPTSEGFQRVQVRPEDHRGGLLSMGAVLGLTSDGTRHRPVHRGVWVSEVFFGRTPPSPPANVDPIEPNSPLTTKTTIRQKIELHRSHPSCAACHAKIDHFGIAWDNYDAIGQWRTHEKVEKGVGDDPAINSSGLMPDGRAFHDAVEFKQRLLEDRDQIARAFIEHLCTYALRRVLSVDDEDDIRRIVEESKSKEYRVRDMVRAVALSDLMKKR
ncbi:MAG: DUF1592 domain-containing protein [Pirellulales bacterium]